MTFDQDRLDEIKSHDAALPEALGPGPELDRRDLLGEIERLTSDCMSAAEGEAWFAKHDAEVRAEALLAAADALDVPIPEGTYRVWASQWLRERASRLQMADEEARLAEHAEKLRIQRDSAYAEVAALRSALERSQANFIRAVRGVPVRDMTENLAENEAALAMGGGEKARSTVFDRPPGNVYEVPDDGGPPMSDVSDRPKGEQI